MLTALLRRIVSPMVAMTDVIDRIARHEYDVVVAERDRTDEIGRMAKAIEALREGAVAAKRAAEAVKQEHAVQPTRQCGWNRCYAASREPSAV